MKVEIKNQLSRTKLKVRLRKKTNPSLAQTIALALKTPAWNKYVKILSQPTKKYSSINLREIDQQTSMGDSVMIPGRVLSDGEITKKIRICSFGISKEALERLGKTRSEWVSILDEIKKNPKAEGVKLIK